MSGSVADNSARASGVVAAAGGGGKVLQVVTAMIENCNGDTTSGTYVNLNVDATIDITPTLATSKILIMSPFGSYAGHDVTEVSYFRDGTNVNGNSNTTGVGIFTGPSGGHSQYGAGWTWLDSPATTSAVTYNIRHRCNPGGTGAHAYTNYNYMTVMTLLEIDFS